MARRYSANLCQSSLKIDATSASFSRPASFTGANRDGRSGTLRSFTPSMRDSSCSKTLLVTMSNISSSSLVEPVVAADRARAMSMRGRKPNPGASKSSDDSESTGSNLKPRSTPNKSRLASSLALNVASRSPSRSTHGRVRRYRVSLVRSTRSPIRKGADVDATPFSSSPMCASKCRRMSLSKNGMSGCATTSTSKRVSGWNVMVLLAITSAALVRGTSTPKTLRGALEQGGVGHGTVWSFSQHALSAPLACRAEPSHLAPVGP